MKRQDLQVEIRARTAGEITALATRMVQHRPAPLLCAWAFYTLATCGLGAMLLWGWRVHPALALGLVFLLAPIFSLPLTITVGHLVFSPEVSPGMVIKATFRRAPSFLLLFLINRLVTLAGLCLLIVPGLYLWRNSWFLGPIVLLEGSSIKASFRRGRRFASGFHGLVIKYAFNAALLLGYLTPAMASLLYFLSAKVFGQPITVLRELTLVEGYYPFLALAGFALAAPFVTLVWFFVYLDVRIRKEGWDLELSFRARAARMARGHATGDSG